MNARTLLASLLFAAAATPAMANTTKAEAEAQAPKAAAAATADADADRKICKQERPVGSHIPKRICKTAAQWEEDRESARKMMQDLQQRTGSTYSR